MANFNLNEFLLIRSVDRNPEMRGIGVYVVDDVSQQSRVIRHPQNALLNIALVIEVNVVQKKSNLPSIITKVKAEVLSEKTGALKPLYKELASAGISCSAAFISGSTVVGSAAAAAPTGGTSLVVTVISWTAFVTSAAECANSSTRAFVAVKDLYEKGKTRDQIETLERWDNNVYYSTTMDTVSTIGMVSSVASLGMYARLATLKADKIALTQMKTMKGSQRLTPFKQKFGTSIFRNKAENEAIAKALQSQRKGVGDRVIKKLLQQNKGHLSELTLKKFLGEIKEIIEDNLVDLINKGSQLYFEHNKTIEVNCHLVEIH